MFLRVLIPILILSLVSAGVRAAPRCAPPGMRISWQGKDGRFFDVQELTLLMDCDLELVALREEQVLWDVRFEKLSRALEIYRNMEVTWDEELKRRAIVIDDQQKTIAELQVSQGSASWKVWLGVGSVGVLIGVVLGFFLGRK